MIEELEKSININKELINGLPVNNKKNKEIYLEAIDKTISDYTLTLKEIEKELSSRIEKYEKLSPSIQDDNTFKQLLKALNSVSTLNTSYEKMLLDKNIYQLGNMENEHLLTLNETILKIIKKFALADISLTKNDFIYTNYVNEYMKNFFENVDNLELLKTVFDEIYWKSPNLVLDIRECFRYLYIKNEDKFKKYQKNQNKKIYEKFTSDDLIIDSFSKYYLKDEDAKFNDKNTLIYEFVSGSKKVDNYTEDKVDKLISKYFEEKPADYLGIILDLNNVLNELKGYYKYKDIIDKTVALFKEELPKNYLKTNFGEINKKQNKLFSLNKKAQNSFKKTKIDKTNIEVNSVTSEIRNIYAEIDTNIFKCIVKEKLEENSTFFKLLLLISKYYVAFTQLFYESRAEYEVIEKDLYELNMYVLNPHNNFINNIPIINEVNISKIVASRFKMYNIKLSEEDFENTNIDNILNDLEIIITNHRLDKLNIDLNELIDYENIKKVLN